MHTKKQSNIKTFFIVLAGLLYVFCILILFAVFLPIVGIFFSPNLYEGEQMRLNSDAKHAAEDAMAYLDEKYHMDYKLNTFKPQLTGSVDLDSSRKHYNGRWRGKFTVDGSKYGIDSFIGGNEFGDNYQASQIFSAYEELVIQYFPNTYVENDTIYDVEYEIEFWGQHFISGYFSTYYDGTNIGELLLENGIYIDINIDDDVLISDEFWLECEEALANMERDYEGANFRIDEFDVQAGEFTAYGKWKRTHN